MTVFGRTLDAQDIFALVSMLMVLGLWLVVLRRERPGMRWISWTLMQRERDKRDLSETKSTHTDPVASPDDQRGPWG